MVPFCKQTATQTGELSVVQFDKSYAGFNGVLSGIVVAGTAALPQSFKDELFVCLSGDAIGRGNAKRIEDAIAVKKSLCKFCNGKAPTTVSRNP